MEIGDFAKSNVTGREGKVVAFDNYRVVIEALPKWRGVIDGIFACHEIDSYLSLFPEQLASLANETEAKYFLTDIKRCEFTPRGNKRITRRYV